MKLICAPMATLSHPASRILIEKFGGCDEYFNEMINAPSLLHGGMFEKYYINPATCPQKIVWQLTSKNAESCIEAAEKLCSLGGIGIDLNMGCCAPDIVRSGAGISWMLKPLDETEKLVSGVKSVLQEYEKNSLEHRRLSVKCRLGDTDFTDESFFSFTDMLVSNGVELISLHPRTKKENYRDKPRWEYAQKLYERYHGKVEVYVNGDVFDIQSFKKVRETCPDCSGVMIARAIVQKPWLFKQLDNFQKGESEFFTVDMLSLALDFIDDVVKYQPPEFYKTRLQRFFTYFCMNFSFSHYAQTQMINAKDVEDSKNRIRSYFEKVPQDRYKNVDD